jgi:two-component system, NtrC family, sensor kinase
VAGKWRIRHKLMIGLGLVVGIMGLLLGGTLKGLASYRATMNSMDSKLAELKSAFEVKNRADELAFVTRNDELPSAELIERAEKLRLAVDDYEVHLNDTLARHRDTDKGYRLDSSQVEALREHLTKFETAAQQRKPFKVPDMKDDSQLAMESELDWVVRTARDLLDQIYRDLGKRLVAAKPQYRVSMIILFSTSILGTLLMIGLVRFFYKWVSTPLRELQQGAGRVAQGDFNYRIDVHSGDEMEEVATAFNHMTDQLQMTYADLARQVNERSRQLVRSERLASVGFLAAGVAHEINNPLASIAFCSEALESRLSGLLPEVLKFEPAATAGESDTQVIHRYLKMIQQEAFRCKQITERLLEFSRGGEKRREPTDLEVIIRAVLDVVQHLQNGKGKEIVFEAGSRVIAWVNAQEIKSVVLNLVVNALDNMDEGGRLTIRLDQRDGQAILEFADTGCGMTEEVLENIFEPFFTRSRTGKGTGLGLTISHRIVNQHGGEIEAASRGPNQGSTFTVRLPLQPAEPVKEESIGNLAA